MTGRTLVVVLLSGISVVGSACSGSSSSNPADGGKAGSGSGGGAGGRSAGGGSGGSGGSVAGGGTGGTTSGGKPGSTQCTDGIDNDGDGRIDLVDIECVSPLDNDESSFATGIPGDNRDACKQDCFFDGNSGGGDDGCEWQLKCDKLNSGAGASTSCPYDPSFSNCPTTQSAKCIMNCGAITPNGCDCFGCCAVPGLNHAIRLDPACNSANFNNPAVCPVCTQQTSCMKTCGPCQLCLGKTTLEPGCTGTTDGGTATDGGNASDGGVPTPVCPSGQTVCGTDHTRCTNGTACVTGCCVPWIY